MQKSLIFEDAPFPSCHASTIVEVDGGRFLAAWFGGTREGDADVAIWCSRLEPGGWTAPMVGADEPEVPCWNPVLFRDASGRIRLFYKAGPSPQTWSGFEANSTDGGLSFSSGSILPAGILGPIKNKPLRLESGRLVSGTSVESYHAWAAWVELSDDEGESWRRAGPIALPGEPRGVIQPTLFETRHGIRMLLRSTRHVGRVCLADSFDGGETWTPASRTDLPHPNSGLDGVRLEDGRVMLCHNPLPAGRTPLVLSLSRDEGETWTQSLVLEDAEGEYSYPAIIQASDGRIHVTYTWRRRSICHAVVEPKEL
jgi:predicted neuraminidase